MAQEHPFAQYVRILGKGKKGSRSLDRTEARAAMGMILDGEVRPEQLGAFLMLLRVKEEAPEELAGFADAVRERYQPLAGIQARVDWASYAGKKRHLPWFLLSALLLAEQGIPVFMHGARGHTAGRIYTEDMLAQFGLPSCESWQQAGEELESRGFAFMSIDQLCPPLGEIIQLRNILGLRSPVHTLCRMLNPLEADVTVDGVFHPPYAPMHQRTAQLLGTHQAVTVRGDGGEAEIKPDTDCDLHWIVNGELSTGTWPRIYPQRLVKDESLDPKDLLRLWRGEIEHSYGEGAVVSTLAMVLRLLNPAELENPAQLIEQARVIWSERDRTRF
ncbi:glycosyl transferase family protein [Marinobacterium lutimaris]|uniref:Anthranilate phosphoribosyltransferase n=1 Tax=Marinobacterium lutimaris TaxID=568106 RepID=A0A1H5WP27_9GAMM|nr:glycosyl transferase family protein [Marinobacterium lutimaris]SEG01016.1 Anthranilate phosphoribosyltransferase [Marinobacterium lutimaris]